MTATDYIKRIRNQRKKQYALEFAEFLAGIRAQEPSFDGLSYMAAQGVRMSLHQSFRECGMVELPDQTADKLGKIPISLNWPNFF